MPKQYTENIPFTCNSSYKIAVGGDGYLPSRMDTAFHSSSAERRNEQHHRLPEQLLCHPKIPIHMAVSPECPTNGKNIVCPKKLTAFFSQPPGRKKQDGSRGLSQDKDDSYTGLPDADTLEISTQNGPSSSSSSSQPSSVSNSPAKSFLRLDSGTQSHEVSPALEHILTQTAHLSPIAAFPTSNQRC